MKVERSLRASVKTKKYRVQRQKEKITGEVMKTVTLIGISAVIALLLVYFYNFAMCATLFRLHDAEVRGCRHVSEQEVIERAGIVPSMNILRINPSKMERQVKANPWVKDVSVGREFPDRLIIEIVEREPAALIRKEGSLFILDREGEVFKGLKSDDSVNLPVLTGILERGVADKALVRKCYSLMRCLSARESFPQIEHVSEIQVDERFGFTLYTDNGLVLQLGFDGYEDTFFRLRKVLADLAVRGDSGSSYARIDLTNPARVTVAQGHARVHPDPKGVRERDI
ncbi:MAG: FtsQ-type POTRA domain-containing protein [Deltaproteobacteria bacterium]|nr:FtsQ-type POTRA domain-containing protein [Deltaproteobacteria bacterium]